MCVCLWECAFIFPSFLFSFTPLNWSLHPWVFFFQISPPNIPLSQPSCFPLPHGKEGDLGGGGDAFYHHFQGSRQFFLCWLSPLMDDVELIYRVHTPPFVYKRQEGFKGVGVVGQWNHFWSNQPDCPNLTSDSIRKLLDLLTPCIHPHGACLHEVSRDHYAPLEWHAQQVCIPPRLRRWTNWRVSIHHTNKDDRLYSRLTSSP